MYKRQVLLLLCCFCCCTASAVVLLLLLCCFCCCAASADVLLLLLCCSCCFSVLLLWRVLVHVGRDYNLAALQLPLLRCNWPMWYVPVLVFQHCWLSKYSRLTRDRLIVGDGWNIPPSVPSRKFRDTSRMSQQPLAWTWPTGRIGIGQ